MFGKIVAISTVKPVSQNYASATGSARVVKSIYFWSGTKYFKRNTADFHKDGYFLQNAGVTKEDTKQKKSPSWCVMLTLNRKGCKSKFLFLKNWREI